MPQLEDLLDDTMTDYLMSVLHAHQSIVISGNTGRGKTTFMQHLANKIEADDRIILIEDMPEIELEHEDVVNMLVPAHSQNYTNVTAGWLISQSLLMRPDWLLLGEIRGAEAEEYLHAARVNPTIATVHAPDPQKALEKISHFARLNKQMEASQADDIIRENIRCVVHMQLQYENNINHFDISIHELATSKTAHAAPGLVSGGNVHAYTTPMTLLYQHRVDIPGKQG